ncbi:MAG: hypothetical protein AB9860_03550 [Methanomassiliicoccales archaeon]
MNRKVVVLDCHPFKDNRISKQLAVARTAYDVRRINFNFYPDRTVGESDPGSRCFDVVATKNPYLNGVLFAAGTVAGRYAAKVAKSLEDFLSKDDEVVLHVHDPYMLGLAIKLMNIYPRSRLLYDRHEYFEAWTNPLGFSTPGVFETLYGGRADHLITVSKGTSGLPKRLAGKPHAVIPNYPLASQFSNESVMDKIERFDGNGRIDFVYFGVLNLGFDRDIGLMMRVADELMADDPRVNFTVAGRIDHDGVRPMLEDLKDKHRERMCYLGDIPYKEVVMRTQEAHLGFFLLDPANPMFSESMPNSPNKIYEYLLSGTVPIARAVIDDREIIEKCSLMFGREASQSDILTAIKNLLADPGRMKELMRSCFQTGSRFTWEQVGQEYLTVYRNLFDSLADELSKRTVPR